MIITICGSIAFIDQMYMLKEELEALGFEVKLPPRQEIDQSGISRDSKEVYAIKKSLSDFSSPFWQYHSERIRRHFNKVELCDAILVANYDKNAINGYIGPNTLMEMGLAFHFKKTIFLLNPLPEISYKEELVGMKPIILNGDLKAIRQTANEV